MGKEVGVNAGEAPLRTTTSTGLTPALAVFTSTWAGVGSVNQSITAGGRVSTEREGDCYASTGWACLCSARLGKPA